MKECTNCIHVDVCDMHCEQQNVQGCSDCMLGICTYYAAEKCPNFQDASKFIELPCPVGATLYRIDQCLRPCSFHKTYIDEYHCIEFYNCSRFSCGECDSHMVYHILEIYNADAMTILGNQKYLGTKVFLTREDAEKKLEELNNG